MGPTTIAGSANKINKQHKKSRKIITKTKCLQDRFITSYITQNYMNSDQDLSFKNMDIGALGGIKDG